ncbi:MAG: hypothetical protein IPK03_10295 [Bacteroidetes bacterium]|nr:hypothetical protein [Bacteroidota bacterium]
MSFKFECANWSEQARQHRFDQEVDLGTYPFENINPVFQKIEEAPKPASDLGLKKEFLHRARLKLESKNQSKSANAASDASEIKIEPSLQFVGNNPSSTPNDNSCAMSDSGHIISVVNSNMAIYNDTGKQLRFIALSSFASSVLGTMSSISDPRVIYDPNEKKFIVTFFLGATSRPIKYRRIQ